MHACPDENLLTLLAEGELGPGLRVALERHLDSCAACSRLVAELAGLAGIRDGRSGSRPVGDR
jgi:anti-sigma factor RsiW